MKRLVIVPLVMMLVAPLAGGCSSSASKEKEQAHQDSIAASAELEEARLDSIRQDSIDRRNFTSPDLAFYELHGDVKKCVYKRKFGYSPEDCITFDENGKWTNDQWSKYEKKYCPDRTKHPRVTRNKDGYITKIYCECDFDYEYINVKWKNGKVQKCFLSTYRYNDDGLVIGCVDDEEFDYQESATYSNYVLDDMGNWIKRDVTIRNTDTYSNSSTIRKETETRTIEYYKSNGGGSHPVANTAKQNKAIAANNQKQQKQQEESPQVVENHINSNANSSGNNIRSNNTSFSSAQDVMRYLDGKTFYDGSDGLRIGFDAVYMNGRAMTGAPRVTNFGDGTATIVAHSPYAGNGQLTFRINASAQTITQAGETYHLR